MFGQNILGIPIDLLFDLPILSVVDASSPSRHLTVGFDSEFLLSHLVGHTPENQSGHLFH